VAASATNPQRSQFVVEITCHRCAESGSSVWENGDPGDGAPPPSLVSLPDGFYERMTRKRPHEIEVVCHRCGTVQLG
jgi:hypothetical protein